MRNDIAPELIDAAALASLLSVSKPTVWRLKEAGKLPPAIALTSQCIRWRRSDIDGWLAAGCPCPDVRCGESLPNIHSQNSNEEKFRATN